MCIMGNMNVDFVIQLCIIVINFTCSHWRSTGTVIIILLIFAGTNYRLVWNEKTATVDPEKPCLWDYTVSTIYQLGFWEILWFEIYNRAMRHWTGWGVQTSHCGNTSIKTTIYLWNMQEAYYAPCSINLWNYLLFVHSIVSWCEMEQHVGQMWAEYCGNQPDSTLDVCVRMTN